jgi:hypothetical protein
MTPGMEPASPPVEELTVPPVDAYSGPLTEPAAQPSPTAWRPPVASRSRRLWTAALAAALLVSVGGIGLLYVDDTNNQATIRDLTSKN